MITSYFFFDGKLISCDRRLISCDRKLVRCDENIDVSLMGEAKSRGWVVGRGLGLGLGLNVNH